MSAYSVERSSLRKFLFGIAGLILILAAVDMIWTHKVSEPPTTDDSGILTSRGRIDQRTDIIWGGLFLLAGGATLVLSIAGLVVRRPVLEATETAVALRLMGYSKAFDIAWNRIAAVRSGSDENDSSGGGQRMLYIEVDDASQFPQKLWGAEWRGTTLAIDTDSWATPAEDLAVQLNIDIARARDRASFAAEQDGS